MNAPLRATRPVVTADAAPGWHGRLALRYARRAARSALVKRTHSGPLYVQRTFHPEGDAVCHSYLLHPPGGIVGGDTLDVQVTVDAGAHALITTPGATKCYRSAGPQAGLTQQLVVADGAVLEWLPQETLCHAGARVQARTSIALARGASFIGWDILCLGRPAAGERFTAGELDLRVAITRDGRPLLLDRLHVTPDTGEGPAGWRGAAATGSLYASPSDETALAALRTLCAASPVAAGVTQLGELLVLRCLAPDTFAIRALFARAWASLRPALLGRAAVVPRIWNT